MREGGRVVLFCIACVHAFFVFTVGKGVSIVRYWEGMNDEWD